ncbi:MAG: polysaccharide deacetylase family protein [Candidatus Nanoarchaeia archaeon]
MQEEKGQQGLLKQAGNFLIENLDELLEKYIENQHVNNEEKAKYPVREAIKRVPILMYHEIGYPEESSFSNRYVVTPDNFRKQLEFLNKNDYVPISIDEYLKDDFSQIPEDKLPIILTFDDATKGQFRYLEDKKIDPESAVGIMDDFAKEHDDWRQRASFFIDFVDRDGFFQVPFAQEEKEKDKISYLQENGYEVYCHTMYHPSLERVSFKDLLNDIRTFKYLVGQMDIEKSNIIAVPYGAYPQIDKTWQFLDKNFDYYFAAYARTRDKRAKRVNSEHFDNKYIPRIEVPPNNLSKLESYINGF